MTAEIEQVYNPVNDSINDTLEQVRDNQNANMEISSATPLPASNTIVINDSSASDSAEEMWQSF
jgi:hypothetical protein